MSDKPNNLKERVKEHSEKLSKLGTDLAKNQFIYKVEKKSSKEYWQERISNFKKYNENGFRYYDEIFALMRIIDEEKSQMFLLQIAKFRQLGLTLIEIMEKLKDNPSIINSKDRQQSQWSREIKNQITEQSDKCLKCEREMNTTFREFYEEKMKEILE
jgi:predicted  nucleic acid-binding Zn-ribbon protein